MSTKPEVLSSASMVDVDGDELRIDMQGEKVYVTASQEQCTATVGPFTRIELEAILALAGMGGHRGD